MHKLDTRTKKWSSIPKNKQSVVNNKLTAGIRRKTSYLENTYYMKNVAFWRLKQKMDGWREIGRKWKLYIKNIKEWTRKEETNIINTALNRDEFAKIVTDLKWDGTKTQGITRLDWSYWNSRMHQLFSCKRNQWYIYC